MRLLVAAGADVNLADGDGKRPLAHAEERGFDAIARILRRAGARPRRRALTRTGHRDR